jgi:hypothetical protein
MWLRTLPISERQVCKLAAENRIPSFQIGDSLRFDPAAFATWLGHKMGPGDGGCEWPAKGEKSLGLFEILSRVRVVREETFRYRKANNGGMHAEDFGRLTPRPKRLLEEKFNSSSRRGCPAPWDLGWRF